MTASDEHESWLPNLVGGVSIWKLAPDLNEEQQERMMVLFEILIALFERAYLLAYEENMTDRKRRRWLSWEDYMREWCARADFRDALPTLLQGEDADFAAHIRRIAEA